jgi:Protein of unknown function, DUF547
LTALAAALLLPTLLSPGPGRLPDPAPFDAVLADRARGGGFDYRGATGQDRKRLAAYLANLADARPAEMSAEEKKAFYVDAYNATAIGIVLDRYPVKSIRDIDGAFRRIRRRIGGEDLSLDDVENRLREFKDARIHFAIVCVSESCPPLRPTAYRSETISADLDRQARVFINDPRKNEIDRARGRLALSKIFDWNHAEFERDAGSISRFVARYVADPETASWLTTARPTPQYLEYDWSLNQR